MCGRYYNRRQKQEIAEAVHAGKIFDAPYISNYNIAPTTFQPIVRQFKEEPSIRELALAQWGMVPFFAPSREDFKGFSTFNARGETVATAPTWREAFRKRRCIVPADGFYEWKKLDDSKKPAKQPYAIHPVDGGIFAFAGVWDAWKNPADGSWLQSFAIITTDANELMSPIHNRMPVILHERDWNRWLDREFTGQLPTDLIRSYEPEMMRAEPCNPAVGAVKNNSPDNLICPTGSTADNSK